MTEFDQKVRAMRIDTMESQDDTSVRLTGRHEGITYTAYVSARLISKHQPNIGDYYLQYRNGQEAFKRPEAFHRVFQRSAETT